MNILLQSHERVTKPTRDALEPFLQHFQPVRVSAKVILSEPGGVNGAIWYVDTGMLRSYIVLEEEKEGNVATNREIRDLNETGLHSIYFTPS
jgi:hypothetical protein